MKSDLVSVVIPVYNAEQYIGETLTSVMDQTYPNWECIVVDDGSNDGSRKIIESAASKDHRFQYHLQENAGPSAARNRGMRKANGQYIQFLDADDVLRPDRLERLVELYRSTPENTVLYSAMLLGDHKDLKNTSQPDRKGGDNVELDFDRMYREFGVGLTFIPACVLFPSASLSQVRWNEELRHSEDWDLYLQVTLRGYRFRYVDEPLTVYRDVPDSLSKQTHSTMQANLYILSEYGTPANRKDFVDRASHTLERNILLYLRGRIERMIRIDIPDWATGLSRWWLRLVVYLAAGSRLVGRAASRSIGIRKS